MIKYIHIGYPKNLSTSLQRGFFSQHPDILHLGIGCHDSNLEYIDAQIEIAIETHLLYSRDFYYASKASKIKEAFERYFRQAAQDGKKAVGLSQESLSMLALAEGVDATQKAKRLQEIFGNDTQIIMICREQRDMLKSLYRERVKMGYSGTFADYIEYMYKLQDRSGLHELCFDRMYQLYAELFGEGNLHVIFMEEIRERGKLKQNAAGQAMVLQNLADILQIPLTEGTQLSNYNPTLSEAEVFLLREYNALQPHDLGNNKYQICHGHRQLKYFTEELAVAPPSKALSDVLHKREKLARSKELIAGDYWVKGQMKLDYTYPAQLTDQLSALFAASNRHFGKLLNKDLAALGYSC